MRLLCVPSTKHGYVTRLNTALRAHGVYVNEAPMPYLRWPRNLIRFWVKTLGDNDVCHLHWNVFDSLTMGRLFFRKRIPKVWTVHNITPHDPVFKEDLSVTHLYLDRTNVAVWHSQRSIADAKRAFAAKGLPESWQAEDVVIPCMNFNGAFEDTVSDEEARTRLGIGEKEFVVGHYAPTHPYKGTEDFLKLLSMDIAHSVRFCIFGECREPDMGAAIRKAALHRTDLISHLGFISNAEMQYWFKACNVVVQPYMDITTSGSIYFPIAFKKPVIAPPLGNIPDVIQNRITGWLAKSPEEVWSCIKEAMADRQATSAIGARAYEFVEETANIDKIASQYIASYEQAIKG
jgi:glycosyltransferase involved in cell wall biosynthesis